MLAHGGTNIEVDQRITTQHQRGFVKKTAEVLNSLHAPGRTHGSRQDVTMVTNAFIGIANLYTPAVAVAKVAFNFLVVPGHIDHDFSDAVAG